jgi:hypothetical protein
VGARCSSAAKVIAVISGHVEILDQLDLEFRIPLWIGLRLVAWFARRGSVMSVSSSGWKDVVILASASLGVRAVPRIGWNAHLCPCRRPDDRARAHLIVS